MKLTLAENIRACRRQRRMTQENLAEALGVTVGAVHKWETGLSMPELNLIVEMADFFDTSVDALLGYRMQDNRLDATLVRVVKLVQTRDPSARTEMEKALARYPHSFRVVHAVAGGYLALAAGDADPAMLRRSLELLERACALLPQNEDPRVSEATIRGDMAIAWFLLGDREQCVETLKRNNAGGIFCGQIGAYLAGYMDRAEEAADFMTEALVMSMSTMFTAIAGYVFVFRSRKDWGSALAITSWGAGLLAGAKVEDRPGFLEKMLAEMLAMRACAEARLGMEEASRGSLLAAAAAARRFDSTPDYSLGSMRFGDRMEENVLFDILGASAAGGVLALLGLLGEDELSEQWKEITDHET